MKELTRHYIFPELDSAFLDISKNASSNVKRKVMDKLKYSYGYDLPDFDANPERLHQTAVQFLVLDVEKYSNKEVVVIFRDPVERIVSAFNNKFIQKPPMKYTKQLAGYQDNEKMLNTFTFEAFCKKILQSDSSKLNGHWISQNTFFNNKIKYRVFDIKTINNDPLIEEMLGVQLFERGSGIGYANSSSYGNNSYGYLGNKTLSELKVIYNKTGDMPSTADLVSDRTRNSLIRYYKEDHEIYQRFQDTPKNFLL